MDEIKRKHIDWEKTSRNLQMLRYDNMSLRRNVCRAFKSRNDDCSGANCDDCKFDMDNNISRRELAEVFGVTDSVITNWESNRSQPNIDDLIFYSQICQVDLFDILIFLD